MVLGGLLPAIVCPFVSMGSGLVFAIAVHYGLELGATIFMLRGFSPENKLSIIQALQDRHELAAMTGDGVNDAPALRAADVGVAMGMAGTEIAKQAADVVLLDDNFSTIVAAVAEGRRVFDNIQKFVIYLLSCNSSEIIVMLTAVAVGTPLPLTSMMILWANVVADVPPSISLALEPPEPDCMQRPPRRPQEGVVTSATAALILVQGTFMASLALAVYFYAVYQSEYTTAHIQSLTCVFLISLHLWQAFLSRSLSSSLITTGVLANRWLVFAVALSFTLLCGSNYVPGWNTFFGFVPLNAIDWAQIAAGLLALLLFSETLKWLMRRRLHRHSKLPPLSTGAGWSQFAAPWWRWRPYQRRYEAVDDHLTVEGQSGDGLRAPLFVPRDRSSPQGVVSLVAPPAAARDGTIAIGSSASPVTDKHDALGRPPSVAGTL